MANITNLDQVASPNDVVMPDWVNVVATRIKSIELQLADAAQQINELKAQLSQAYKVQIKGNLNVALAGGSVKLLNGTIAIVPPASFNVTNNATTYVYINDSTGTLNASTTRPTTGLEVARVVASGGTITSAQNYPLFETKTPFPDLSQYATIAYADTRSWEAIATAKKTQRFSVPNTDTYYTVPFESLVGTGFNTAGTFTTPKAGKYIFHAQIRVDTTAPQTQPDLSVKLSLFIGADETGLPLMQAESARGDITLNAQNAEPVTLTVNDKAYIKVYLTDGYQARVRENSVVQVWRLP